MGWSYRKSVNLGPFRVNISKSGIGYSLGGAGFRTGVSSGGHRRPRRLARRRAPLVPRRQTAPARLVAGNVALPDLAVYRRIETAL